MDPEDDIIPAPASSPSQLAALPTHNRVTPTPLPAFSLRRYGAAVETGDQKSLRIREQERRLRDELWTPRPGLRPLQEPPAFVWSTFKRRNIKSDLLHRKLFPDDPEKQCQSKDVEGEFSALDEYLKWTWKMIDEEASGDDEIRNRQREFYDSLYEEVSSDWGVVSAERENLLSTVNPLALWEYENLDDDGGTTRLEERLSAGEFVEQYVRQEVKDKYSELFARYPPLARFDAFYRVDEKGMAMVEVALRRNGSRLLYEKEDDVQEKYGQLLARYSPLWRFEAYYRIDEKGMAMVELALRRNGSRLLYEKEDDVQEKYGQLLARYSPLWRFEAYYRIDEKGMARVEQALRDGWQLSYEKEDDVQAKYGQLFRQYPMLDRFERLFKSQDPVQSDNSIRSIMCKESESDGGYWDIFIKDPAVWAKYGHLAPPGSYYAKKWAEEWSQEAKNQPSLDTSIDSAAEVSQAQHTSDEEQGDVELEDSEQPTVEDDGAN